MRRDDEYMEMLRIEAAAFQLYAKIVEAIKEDYNSRFKAVEAWNGFGRPCPVKLVRRYTFNMEDWRWQLYAVESSKVRKVKVLLEMDPLEMDSLKTAVMGVLGFELQRHGWNEVNGTTYQLS